MWTKIGRFFPNFVALKNFKDIYFTISEFEICETWMWLSQYVCYRRVRMLPVNENSLKFTFGNIKTLWKLRGKVDLFWEGHKILRNLQLTFDWHYIGQK